MRVSIVVPALDEEEHIARCLESLRHQGVPVEIVVVDNGSTDRTVEIAERYADRVLVVPKAPLGIVRNRGVEVSTGDIIVSVDADCVAPEGWLERVLSHFDDPEVVAVGGPVRPLSEGEAERRYCEFLNGLLSLGLLSGANMAYRRSAWESVGGYRPLRRGEDWDLSLRLRSVGRVVYDPDAFVYTDVPLSRPLEVASIALSSGLLLGGLATRNPFAIGLGSGFLATEASTAFIREPSDIHHSHVALASLGLLALFWEALHPYWAKLAAGVSLGILWHHWVTEDVGDPAWMAANGSILLGASLLLSALN